MKRPKSRAPYRFEKQWHYIAFGMFAVSWTAMLFPLLLLPDSEFARITTFALLGLGLISVLSLLVDAISNRKTPAPTGNEPGDCKAGDARAPMESGRPH